MSSIKKLETHVINCIKAGEVVERPFNIVKELVENSLDAGASCIKIELVDGGKELIRVSDNGSGMSEEDLPLAFERHATSKLKIFQDLQLLVTHGFRGEALPSIAAVSFVSCVSKQAEKNVAYRLDTVHGERGQVVPTTRNENGTTFTIRELFARIPVRLKFLRSTATELSHIQHFLIAMSFGYPHVSWDVVHNSKKVFSYEAQSTLEKRFAEIVGPYYVAHYAPVDFTHGGFSLQGFVSLPSAMHATAPGGHSLNLLAATHFYTLVNQRYIKDKILKGAILRAYAGLLEKGAPSPSCLLRISLKPEWIDINAHPAKTEVRFKDLTAIDEWVSRGLNGALKQKIQTSAMIPDGQMPLTPVHAREWLQPSASANEPVFATPPRVPFSSRDDHLLKSVPSVLPDAPVVPQQHRTTQLFSLPEQPKHVLDICSAHYLGQYKRTYLLFEDAQNQLMVVDQHAFAERILFEEFQNSLKNNPQKSQKTLMPVAVSITLPAAYPVDLLLQDHQETWQMLGFECQGSKQKNTIEICAFPSFLDQRYVQNVVQDICRRLAEQSGVHYGDALPVINTELEQGRGVKKDQVFYMLLATMACHSAVRAGDELDASRVRILQQKAAHVDFYAHCPHGRPVARLFQEKEVGGWFLRF